MIPRAYISFPGRGLNGGKPLSVARAALWSSGRGTWSLEDFRGDPAVSTDESTEQGYTVRTTNNGAGNTNGGGTRIDMIGNASLSIPDDEIPAVEEGAAVRQNIYVMSSGDIEDFVLTYRARLDLGDFVPSGTNECEVNAGLMHPESSQRPSSDGIFWRASEADANWILVHARGGTDTELDSGVALAANTIVNLTYVADGASGVIRGYIDGSFVGTVEPATYAISDRMTSQVLLHAFDSQSRANDLEIAIDTIMWALDFLDGGGR